MAFPEHFLSRLALFCSVLFRSINANDLPTTIPTRPPSKLVGTAFIPDSHPRSLQGSIITAIDGTLTYRLSCPTGTSPENLACQKENKYPALATHSPGSVFAGAFTTGITTRWDCALGTGSGDTITDEYGICNKTTIDGDRTSVSSTTMNNCYVVQHQVPVTFTSGLEFLHVDEFGLQDGESLAYAMDQGVSQACKGSTSSTEVTETGKGSVITTTSSSDGVRTTGSSTSSRMGLTLSSTSSSTAPTSSASKSGAFRSKTAPGTAVVMVGVVAAISL